MPKAKKHVNSSAAKIRIHLRANPTATPKEVSEVFGVTPQYVSVVKYNMQKAGEKTATLRVKTPKPKATRAEWKTLHVSTSDTPVVEDTVTNTSAHRMVELTHVVTKGRPIVNPQIEIPITMEEPASDPVNHPAHYKVGGIETIDFIEAKRLNYNMGNAVKYITRADHKGSRKQDLEKAIWYLKRELEHSL